MIFPCKLIEIIGQENKTDAINLFICEGKYTTLKTFEN
jgi:hypothetical protein